MPKDTRSPQEILECCSHARYARYFAAGDSLRSDTPIYA